MRKKTITKKPAKKSKKKEMKKKKETTLNPAKKTITKKKKPEKTKPKIKKKEPTKKTAKKAIKKIKVKEKPKKAVKKIEKKPEKAVKKVTALKKPKKKVDVKVKTKEKPEKAVKKVIAKIEKKPKKIIKKVVAEIAEKIPSEGIKKVEPGKTPEKPEKMVEIKVKTKVKEKPGKAVVKIAEKGKKIPVEVKKKEVYPETEYAPMAWEKLPSEYGENGITLMTVDPNKLFTFWEVREDTLAIYTGNLTVRLYDVTGVDFDGTNANSYYDITVNERIGSSYIDVSPEKEFIADIGIINFLGTFFTIIRSNRVSTPRATIAEEGILPQKFYEIGIRVGY
jgi:hypothetical protein